MKVVVLGPNGMLGSMIVFVGRKRGACIQSIPKSDFCVGRDAIEDLSRLLGTEKEERVCIVNCIGCIPQRQYSEEEYIRINQEFPHELARFCKVNQYGLIHMSTNCVFSGTKPYCREDNLCDAEDLYGQTKARGEPSYGLVIRSSIIGAERHSSAGLLAWFLTNPSPEINGFLHQYWNGVTTYELASYMYDTLLEKAWASTTLHVSSARTLSKYELLESAKRVFQKDIRIHPYECPLRYYTLVSQYELPRKDIEEQLQDLRMCYDEFMKWH